MSDLPDTIWLTNFIKDDCGAKLGRGTISDLDHGTEYPEYRRADLPPTPAQIMADPRVKALAEALEEARRVIGDHAAPYDCYNTGPLTGDDYRDLVQCPACTFIVLHDAALAQLKGSKK